jgi:hypothetical protein
VTAPATGGPLFDGRGCLTAAGLAAVQGAPPGRAPSEVASHLAGCGRCQQRLLSGLHAPGAAPPARRGAAGPRLVWLAVLVLGALFALVAGLFAMRSLAR